VTASPRRVLALAVAAFVAGVVDVVLVLSSDFASPRGFFAATTLVIGWSFVGTGLYAWRARPESRMGVLMTAVGFAWFINPLQFANASWLFLIGGMLGELPIAILAHMMLAFPDGRLHDTVERRVVGLGYFTATLLEIPVYLFFDTGDSDRCKGCPDNPILVHGSTTATDVAATLLNLFAVVVVVSVIVLMRRRWKSSSGPQRRGLGPVIVAGALTFTGFAISFIAFLATGEGAGDSASGKVLYIIGIAVFASVPFAFLTGVMRMRLLRADAVGQLVERLARSENRDASMRDVLAEALGDPGLEVAYCMPERNRFMDVSGKEIILPGADSDRVVTPLTVDGERIAVVVTEQSLVEEALLVRAVAPAVALTLENERLTAELRAHVEDLRASRARIVRAGDEERRRLERDLHDGAQQRLVALSLNLKLAQASLESDPAGASELIDDAITELTEATAELRELARGIHPAILTDRGLEAAVKALASRAKLPVELLALPEERLAAPVEATAYFVVAESLTNVARYSQASHAEVEIRRDNGRLVVEVRDDGVGGADPTRGSGLRGLADRVGAVDGRLAVESPPGAGTTVRVEIPCAP
jgi:signal transduction histidine kinase